MKTGPDWGGSGPQTEAWVSQARRKVGDGCSGEKQMKVPEQERLELAGGPEGRSVATGVRKGVS